MATLRRFPGVYTTLASSQDFVVGNIPQPVTPPAPPPPAQDTSTSTPDATAVNLLGFGTFGPLGLSVITINTAHSLGGFDFENDTTLVTLNFPNLIDIDPTNTQGGFLFITGCTLLTTVTLPHFVPNNGGSYSITACALSASTVNAILAQFKAAAGFVSGSLDLSGGTSAAPTGQGITDKATLIGRGVTVTTN